MAITQDPTHPTGVVAVPPDRGGTHLTKARARKAYAALELKVKGHPAEKIAAALGYPNARAVGVAIELALGEELRETDKAILRSIAVRRLEQAWRSLADKIADPAHPDHIAAINTGVKVIAQHSRMMGLDAPTEILVNTPSGEEMQRYVDEIMEERRRLAGGSTDEVVEADILDVESEWVDEDDDFEEVDDSDLEEVEDPDAVPTR